MQDLSHTLPGDPVAALTGRESMAATNTISEAPPCTAPGSESESASAATAGTPGPHGTSYDGRHLVHGSGS